MNLNLHILAEELGEMLVDSRLSDGPEKLACTHPILFVPGMDFFAGPVYVAKAEDLPDNPPHIAPFNLACVGMPSQGYFNGGINLIVVRSEASPLKVFSIIMDVFMRYAQWGRRLDRIMEDRCVLREFAVASVGLFGNPVSLWSAGFRSVFYVAGNLDDESNVLGVKLDEFKQTLEKFRDGRLLPLDDVRTFTTDSNFTNIMQNGLPAIFDEADRFPCRALIYPIYKQKRLLAYLIIDEVNKPLTARDAACSVILGSYIRKIMASPSYGAVELRALDDVLKDLMDSLRVDDDRLESAMSMAGWSPSDEFVVYAVAPVLGLKMQYRTSFMDLFGEHDLQNIRLLSADDPCALLVNRTQLKNADLLLENVLIKSPKEPYNLGASESFSGLSDLRFFYKQAAFALDCLQGGDGKGSLSRYSVHYTSDMIARCSSGWPKGALLPESLRRLVDYDEANGSDLTAVLAAYLECNLNISRTARKMFIHRNTCIGKINHIKEIGGFDFDDPDVVLGLRIALKIRDSF